MKLSRAVSIFFGAGLLRPAPGTWGSAVAVALGLLIHGIGHFPLLAAATLAAIGWGVWACEVELFEKPGQDPSEIVIDEVAGQWVALLFPSFGFWLMGLDSWNFPYPGWLAAFVFFRLFDIWKPWLVGRADRRHDATGVMLDDLWAGVFAGVATMIAAGLSHGLLM
ncbi:phosphatidylglycerophosphatase A family protein [Lutimaribacter saemankumensis]|uniref:Phosphatidylglycerophosphatase A n=1 Tax=Lutimaribacter saemankumensis TaxID=490829 RepID=A0A1G8HH56_9RHOB|nr:phosphatidylglycerophosphatase A [Lutimaribacter saemankumensis]SDI05902.1 phosphatidylglycerophosphatase A [Lutimaribacter saemankumensis]